jgi:NitT/TauT family transport system permease protein
MPAKGITAFHRYHPYCVQMGGGMIRTNTDQSQSRARFNRIRRSFVRDVIPPVTVVATGVAVWQIIVVAGGLPAFILPSPADVLRAIGETGPVLSAAIGNTMLSTIIGLSVAIGLAIVVAAAMDLIPFVRRGLYPLLVASQTVQILAIAPLLIIWFGFGRLPTVLVVVLFTFFPMTIATVDGLAATDPDFVELIQSMGGRNRFVWRVVRLPAALPSFFSGLRLSVTYSVVAATIGEWVGGTNGLGLYMLRSKNALKTDQVFVGMIVTTAISIGMFAIVAIIERLAIAWKYRGGPREQWLERGIY